MSIWTPDRDAELRYLAQEVHLAGAARIMGLPVNSVWNRASRHKIKALSQKEAGTPSIGEWTGAAIQEAQDAGLPPGAILGWKTRKAVCRARWKAWRRVLALSPEYSVKGLSRTCGWHHSTILSGLKRLAELEAENG